MNPFPKVIDEGAASEQQQLLKLLQSNPELMQKYKEELAKHSAMNKSIKPPMTNKQYIQKLDTIQQYFDDEGGLTIQPSPSFVLKFLEKRTNQKIFVNIVTHQVIDHPQQKVLVDFENQPGLRIPMSMGRVRQDHDKSGNICKVVDVVLNPTIVKTAQTSPDIFGFTAQIIGNYLLEKYKIAVQQQLFKRVKGVKYKGSKVEIQRVKGRKAPKIEQMAQETNQKSGQRQRQQQDLFNQLNTKKNVIRPQFQAIMYDKMGNKQPFSLLQLREKPAYILITFDLPHLLHSRGIHLQGSDKLIYLFVKGIYEICLKLPFKVGKYTSKFSKKQRKLQIKVQPFEQKQQNDSQMQQTLPNKKQVNNIELQNDLLYDLV